MLKREILAVIVEREVYAYNHLKRVGQGYRDMSAEAVEARDKWMAYKHLCDDCGVPDVVRWDHPKRTTLRNW